MVKLSQKSSVDPAYRQSREWDELFRHNYSLYQDRIDKLTYSLQRKQRGWFTMPYPRFYQADIQKLQVLKNMQQLGAVKEEQLDAYKSVEPSIKKHYNNVFGSASSILRPSVFQILGIGLLIGSAVIKKPLWSLSSFLIIAPLAFRYTTYNNVHKTNEFLDFTLKVRIQKCILERLAIDNGESLPSNTKKGKK